MSFALMYVVVSVAPGARLYYCGAGDNHFAPRASADRRDAVLFCSYSAALLVMHGLCGAPPGHWRVESAVMTVQKVGEVVDG